MNANPVSLSAFQQMLGDTIRMNSSLHGVWVTAELSDVRVAGGHCYMELIEKDEASGQVKAKMRAMIWSNLFRMLQAKFLDGTGSTIRSGLKVMVCGSASHHNIFGLSFSITDIDPAYTVGDIERQRREILSALEKEGVIDFNRSLPFPEVPQRIAVVSAEGAAGFGDFMDHLFNAPEGFRFYPLLVPAVMQGERTASTVAGALDFIESTIDFWDCAVIIRGGGSTTDMHCFDNLDLARRVASFPLPVVVGIGHERDRNVLDEIACRRCKTPTAVADFLVECCRNAWERTEDAVREIAGYVSDRMQGERLRLSNIENLLPARVNAAVMRQENVWGELRHRMAAAAEKNILSGKNTIGLTRMKLTEILKGIVERPRLRLERLEDMLRVLSPENTLRRGYSITRKDGKAIYDSACLKRGDRVVTQFYKGESESTIE